MSKTATTIRRVAWCIALGLTTMSLPVAAFADDTSLETPQMKEAKERYDRGLKLFADKDYEAARIEFKKAYELVPSFKILYNIGVCDANRNDYVGAIENLQKYLQAGEVQAERRTEVETLLKDIRPRIGHILVKSNVDGAAVVIDDVKVGITPMTHPIDVNPGTRKVSITKSGYLPATQAVTVAGSETDNVDLAMQPTTTITIHKGVSPLPFVLWGTTAALAIGAGVTGFLALKASDDLNTLDNTFPADSKALAAKRSDMRTLSIIADTLTGAAIVLGAVSIVVTVVTFGKKKEDSVALTIRPGGLGLAGTF